MPPSDIAVSVRGLSKSYNIAVEAQRHTTAAEAIVDLLKNPRKQAKAETFWALQDVSFDIRRGDVVGIIGRNGAGKSTLLKILSRIAEPTTGQIDIYGRVGSLLEVGTGFHPELTGRENIFLNGAMLGMTKREIARRFDEIIEFAEIGRFLDTPVKRYSSGMYVRLAFAVAAHLTPEILIVDEVLAVGDIQFQKKCLGKMQDVSEKEGRTILFVSHQIAPIQKLCNRLMVFAQGRLVYQGDVEEGVASYMEQFNPGLDLDAIDWQERRSDNPEGAVKFTGFRVLHDSRATHNEFKIGEKIGLLITVECARPQKNVCVGYTVLDLNGSALFTSHHDDSLGTRDLPSGETVLESWIDPNYLQPGKYVVQIGVHVNSVGQDFVPNAATVEIVGILGAAHAKMDVRPGVIRIDFPWRFVTTPPVDANGSVEGRMRLVEANND